MALKIQRELETKIHEQVYKNIHLLTLVHPPDQEFNYVFKKDMFVKNNKAAFHQVIYYLLNILNADKFKQKISIWPIFEIRQETQFRNEIMRYLNELNSIYEDANMPTIMASHLISPGGYKFAKFMLKLSQLVLYEHLKNDPSISDIMCRIRPNKVATITENNIKRLSLHTQKNNKCTAEAKSKFVEKFIKCKEEANQIIKEQNALDKELRSLQDKCDRLQLVSCEFQNTAPEESLKEKMDVILKISEKFKMINTLCTYLTGKDLCLNYETPNPSEKELNLLHFFEEFNTLMAKRCLDIHTLNSNDLQMNVKKYNQMNEQLSKVSNNFNEIHKRILNLIVYIKKCNDGQNEQLKTTNPLKVSGKSDDLDSTVLAVPLESTIEENSSNKVSL